MRWPESAVDQRLMVLRLSQGQLGCLQGCSDQHTEAANDPPNFALGQMRPF